jgi:hypothetical protein
LVVEGLLIKRRKINVVKYKIVILSKLKPIVYCVYLIYSYVKCLSSKLFLFNYLIENWKAIKYWIWLAFDYILNSQFTLELPRIKFKCYQSYHLYPASFCMKRFHMLRLIKLFLNYFYGTNYFEILFFRDCLGIIISSYLSKSNRKWLNYWLSKTLLMYRI